MDTIFQFDTQSGSQVDYIGLRFEPSFYDGEEYIKCAMCVNITDVFKKPSDKVIYINDFRREWTHEIMLQRILTKPSDLNSGGNSDNETFEPDKFDTITVDFISEEHHSVLDNLFLPPIYCYDTCRRENHPNSQRFVKK